tara:strand:+ start:2426 stop:3187 length:762 start_codon:yes stop_codon:yes gene_type:complete
MSSEISLTTKLKNLNVSTNTHSYWEAFRKVPITSTIASCPKKEIVDFATSYNDVYSIALHLAKKAGGPGSSYRAYYVQSIVSTINDAIMRSIPEEGDFILKKSDNMSLKCHIFDNGLYSSVKMIDFLADKAEGSLQVSAARACSIRMLRKLNKRKTLDNTVRKIVYERLGPVECLDQMIDDKYAANRETGYAWAPYGYSKLEEKAMTEIARGPTSFLIRKLKIEFIPLMLANRNVLKNKWIANMVEQRMNRGV